MFYNSQFNRAYFFLFLIMLIFSGSFSQLCAGDISGKIITKDEANSQFGTVLISVSITTAQVQTWLNSSNNYIMFYIRNNQLTVLDDNRNVLYPAGTSVNSSDVFYKYSISKVTELISLGGMNSISFELRQNVFSLTDGDYTLEFGSPCPPFCR